MPATTETVDGTSWLWSHIVWRHWLREWKLTTVLLLIIALGVAVFLSIRLANKAAVSGFGMFTESLSGESDYQLRPSAGLIPNRSLRDLRSELGSLPVGLFPVVETTGIIAGGDQSLIRVIGLDLVAMQNAVNYAGGVSGPRSNAQGADGGADFLDTDRLVFSGDAFSQSRGVSAGDELTILFGDREASVEVGGILPENPNLPSIPENLILVDLPSLQTMAGLSGLSRIEVRFPMGAFRSGIEFEAYEILDAIALKNGWLLETPLQRKESVTQMSAAFRLNLTILSGLALLVGTYLIMQAMEAAVIKRRSEMAVLRSLGVTPLEIRKLWVYEGLVLGVMGSVLGVVVGVGLAQVMVGAIGRTVNTLYYETTSNAIRIELGEILFSMVFGVFASLVAVLIPARDASLTPPAQMMRQGAPEGGLTLLRQRWFGIAVILAGWASSLIPPYVVENGPVVSIGGYLAAVLMVVGGSILIGVFFNPVSRAIRKLGGRRKALSRYAASQIATPVGRHLLTAAGLAVAIGMSAAMGILVASFEGTLTAWIKQILKADLYISGGGNSSVDHQSSLAFDTWQRIEKMPGVSGVDVLRQYRFNLDGKDTVLGASDYNDDPDRTLQMIWLDAPGDKSEKNLLKLSGDETPAWISESFSRRFAVRKGDSVTLPSPDGPQALRITGLYADYGNEAGMVVVHRKFTADWFSDDSITNMALYLESGSDPEELAETIRSAFPSLKVQTNKRLREDSLRIFHETFAVTYALEGIAVLIAVSGLGLALAGLLIDRREELTTLKSLGSTRKEIAGGAMLEGLGIAVVGLIGGFLISFALGWVLIDVINPQSFGWTLTHRIPWSMFVMLALITLMTAAAVAYLVGYRNAVVKSDQED